MRLSSTIFWSLTLFSAVTEAVPTPESSFIKSTTIPERDEMEGLLAEYAEFYVKRAEQPVNELATREYTIVTNVLAAIKDTDIAPVVLKSFVDNSLLSNLAIEGVLATAKSGILSAKSLLSLLVQSGLITSVLNDVIGNCEVYVSLSTIGESLFKSLLKRDDTINTEFLTYEEGLALLRRDGLLDSAVSYEYADSILEARDIDTVVINLLESLASSGLGTQVVEALLTDPNFVSFGAKLIQALYSNGLLKIGPLVSAITESGLLPALMKELLNISTLEKIAKTAISAVTGKCSNSSNTSTKKPASTTSKLIIPTPSTSTGSGVPSGVRDILGNFLGNGSGGSTKSIATTAALAKSSPGICPTTVTKTVYACQTTA